MIAIETKRAKLGLVKTNAAYVLVETAALLIGEAQEDFKAEGYVMNKEVRNKMEWLKSAMRELKVRCKDFTYDAHHVKNSTEIAAFCEDAAFLKKFIMVVVDRSGEDPTLFKQLYYTAFNHRTKMDLL